MDKLVESYENSKFQTTKCLIEVLKRAKEEGYTVDIFSKDSNAILLRDKATIDTIDEKELYVDFIEQGVETGVCFISDLFLDGVDTESKSLEMSYTLD